MQLNSLKPAKGSKTPAVKRLLPRKRLTSPR